MGYEEHYHEKKQTWVYRLTRDLNLYGNSTLRNLLDILESNELSLASAPEILQRYGEIQFERERMILRGVYDRLTTTPEGSIDIEGIISLPSVIFFKDSGKNNLALPPSEIDPFINNFEEVFCGLNTYGYYHINEKTLANILSNKKTEIIKGDNLREAVKNQKNNEYLHFNLLGDKELKDNEITKFFTSYFFKDDKKFYSFRDVALNNEKDACMITITNPWRLDALKYVEAILLPTVFNNKYHKMQLKLGIAPGSIDDLYDDSYFMIGKK